MVESHAGEVIRKLRRGISAEDITEWCRARYDLPETECIKFIEEVQSLLQQMPAPSSSGADATPSLPGWQPAPLFSRRVYKIDRYVVAVGYGDVTTELLIHPKLAHLETGPGEPCDDRFEVFGYDGKYVLRVNGSFTGQWSPSESHFFTGKVTMELLNGLYHKTDDDWLGVFHASAVGNKQSCMMFLGDSGHGKSTLSTILMSHGFDLLCDDFAPVESSTGKVFSFPAAVSVKERAVDLLRPLFPHVESAAEVIYPDKGKIVRYLAPSPRPDAPDSYPCKALVFVKYQPGSGMQLEPFSKDVAFQQLVPDSWLSPLPANAARFLDWFIDLPCYRLIYSDNEKMVQAICELFGHE